MNAERYLSDKQVAEMFSVDRSTIWRWVQTRGLPEPITLAGTTRRWRLSDVQRWAENDGRAA